MPGNSEGEAADEDGESEQGEEAEDEEEHGG